jgi:thiamine-phosphate pyrophosphorylase
MALPRLIVITDWALPERLLLSRLEAALSLGPEIGVQMRHPGIALDELVREGSLVSALAAKHGNPVFLNGPAPLARRLGTHLHLRADAPPTSKADLAPGRWISAAIHAGETGWRKSEVDLGLVSPVFEPGSKEPDDRPTLGPQGFRAMAATLPFPAFALGGVTSQTIHVLKGVAGVAVVSAVLRSEDPRAAAAALLEAL